MHTGTIRRPRNNDIYKAECAHDISYHKVRNSNFSKFYPSGIFHCVVLMEGHAIKCEQFYTILRTSHNIYNSKIKLFSNYSMSAVIQRAQME